VVREAIPLTAAGRPPTYGGPPLGTTFSNEPDDRDDMLTHLKDDVSRLIRAADAVDRSSISTYMRLLDQRRDWLINERAIETMFERGPAAPLGIADNPYDLAGLSRDPISRRSRQYDQMLHSIDLALSRLWERMLASEETAD